MMATIPKPLSEADKRVYEYRVVFKLSRHPEAFFVPCDGLAEASRLFGVYEGDVVVEWAQIQVRELPVWGVYASG